MASFGSGFAEGLNSGAMLVQRWRDNEYRNEQRDREREQWAREDENRAAMKQLGYDAKNGVMVPGSDNSYDVAEGKRLGMNVPSTAQRAPMSDVDIESRLGGISLNAGDIAGYRQSLVARKALEQEAADKAFGADLQNIARGDVATLGKYAKEYNKDTTTPGMVTLINGQPHFVNPDTGTPQPVSFAQIAQFLGASHAMGRGDWKTGASMMFQQQQYGDQRADKTTELRLQDRQVATGEKNASTNLLQAQNQGAYQQGMLALGKEKNAIDRMEAGARAGAANQMGRFGPVERVVGPDGQPRTVVTVMGRDGTVSQQEIPLPPGFTYPKQAMDPREERERVEMLMGQINPSTDKGGKGGRTYTYQEALSLVRGPQGGGPSPLVASDVAKVNQLLTRQVAPQAPAAPAMAGRGAPRPQASPEAESPTARARREAYQRRQGER